MHAALFALQVSGAPIVGGDSLLIHDVAVIPAADASLDTAGWGPPQVAMPTGQGRASVWLLRAADTVFIAARIPDRSVSWADGLSVCLDVSGDRAAAPAHDDFQFTLRRVLDSSVVYRGRAGRWQPPHDDPDWRLGPSHAGGGWAAAVASDSRGWSVVLRLDSAWFAGETGHRPGVGFVIHDDDPNGWYAWPPPERPLPPTRLEQSPRTWMPVGLPP